MKKSATKINLKTLVPTLLLILALLSSLLMISSFTVKKVMAAETTVMVTAENGGEPNSNSQTKFVLSFSDSSQAGDTVTVWFRTRNGSAVAGRDYEPVENSITLSVGQSFAVYVRHLDRDQYGLSNYRKEFFLEIYRVSKGRIDPEQSSAKGVCLPASKQLSVGIQDGLEYLSATKFATDERTVKGKWFAGANLKDTIINSPSLIPVTPSEFRNYSSANVNHSGYDMALLTLPSLSDEEYFKRTGGELWAYLSSNWSSGIWGSSQSTSLTVRGYTTPYEDKSKGVLSSSDQIYQGAAPYETLRKHGGGTVHPLENAQFSPAGNSRTEIAQGKRAINLAVFPNVLDTRTLAAYFTRGGPYNVQCTNLVAHYAYIDRTAPKVIGYDVQNASYRNGDKVTLSVRFSELVRFYGLEVKDYPSVLVQDGFGDYLTFSYDGGAGTDTLYFSTILPEKSVTANNYLNLKELKIWRLDNFGVIRDFAYGVTDGKVQSNRMGELTGSYPQDLPAADVNLSLNIDTRIPKLEIGNQFTNRLANGATKSPVSADTNFFEAGAEIIGKSIDVGTSIQYAWSERADPSLVQTWNTTEFVDRGDRIAASVWSGTFGSTAYLHAKYTAPNGHVATLQKQFNFDSTPPEVSIVPKEGDNPNKYAKSHTVSIEVKDLLVGLKSAQYAVTQSQQAPTAETAWKPLAVSQGQSTVELVVNDRIVQNEEIGRYYVHVRAVDNNEVMRTESSPFALFIDLRPSATVEISIVGEQTTDPDITSITDIIDSAYYQSATMTFRYLGSEWGIKSYKFNGKEVSPIPTPSEGADDGSGIISKTIIFSQIGYYELTLGRLDSEDTVQRSFYVYKSLNDGGINYASLHKPRYLVTKYWQLRETKLYRLGADGRIESIPFCPSNDSKTLVFSTYQKAYDFIWEQEQKDIFEFRLTEEDVRLIQSGQVNNPDQAEPKVGDKWYRYKPESWGFAPEKGQYQWYAKSLQQNGRLAQSFNINVDRIVGTVTGGAYFQSYKYPSAADRINGDTGTPYLTDEQVRYDQEGMYEDFVTVGEHECRVLAEYAFVGSEAAQLYYRPYNPNQSGSFYLLGTGKANALFTQSGIFEFLEIGYRGLVKYKMYVDVTAPTINFVITNGLDQQLPLESIGPSLSGSTTITAKNIRFRYIEGDEVDPWAVLQVLRGGTQVFSATNSDIEAMGGYLLDAPGTYTINVFDRSGNLVTFLLTLKTTGITMTQQNRTSQFRFIINDRQPSEIRSMEVLFNGLAIFTDSIGNNFQNPSQNTANVFDFYYSGRYSFKITDIYGFTHSQTFDCSKPLPEGKFSIMNETTGRYEALPFDDLYQKVGEGSYLLFASKALRFEYYSDQVKIQWLTEEPEGVRYEAAGSGIGVQSYKMFIPEGAHDWAFKLTYAVDPYVYTAYTCVNDQTPPEFTAIAYRGEESTVINTGATVSADRVVITWKDAETSVTDVSYSFDGKEGKPALGANSFVITQEGEWTLHALNLLGLEGTFTFRLDKTVDAEAISAEGEKLTAEDNTINTDFMIVLRENMQVIIERLDDTNLNLLAIYKDGMLSFTTYYAEGEEGTSEATIDVLLSRLTPGGAPETNAELSERNIYYGLTIDGLPYIGIYAPPKSDLISIYSYRIGFVDFYDNEAQTLIRVSRILNDVTLSLQEGDGYEDFTASATNRDIHLRSQTPSAEVTQVYFRYSETKIFSDTKTVVYNGKVFSEFVFRDNGYYEISTVNCFGNVNIRVVRICKEILLNARTEYADGNSLEIELQTVYSNRAVILYAPIDDEPLQVTATKDGRNISLEFIEDGTHRSLRISGVGVYHVTVRDSFLNEITYEIHIRAPQSPLNDELLSGWNEKALRADEGYTNALLSFTNQAERDYDYIYYTYQGNTYVIYDTITGYAINNLAMRIGERGDGEYRVVFVTKYGDRAIFSGNEYMTAHIRSTPELSLKRVTSGESEWKDYDLARAQELGFWSNYKLGFVVSADKFILTADGANLDANAEIVMKGDMLSASYVIYFLDAYGNEMTFQAHLKKSVPDVQFVDESILVKFEEKFYLRASPALISSVPQVEATISKDGLPSTVYIPGSLIRGDGSYETVFYDLAGNSTAMRFIIDTKVDCKLTLSGDMSLAAQPDGIAVNTNGIRISKSGSETLTITKVVKDGKDQTETLKDMLSFTDAGSYVVTVSDPIGNTTQLTFHILKAAIKEFVYYAPDGYAVSEITVSEGGTIYAANELIQRDEFGKTYVELSGNRIFTVRVAGIDDPTKSYTFQVVTDMTPPTATFTNLAERTKSNVTITAVSENCTANIYRDGKLIKTITLNMGETLSESITEKGNYRITFTDGAGNTTEYTFERLYTMNVSSIILIALAGVVILLAVLFFVRARRGMKIR